MNKLEIDAIKVMVDDVMPLVIDAECARLPAPYAAMARLVADALLPALKTALDAKIDEIKPE